MAAVNWSTAAIVPSNLSLIRTMVAQVAIAAGQAIYEDLTNGGKANLCDADALTSSLCIGLAVNAAKANEPVHVALFGNTVTASTGTPLTKGTSYFIMAGTAGAIVPEGDLGTDPTTGDYITFVGTALSTTALFVTPVASQVTK
jgi:hypothetical protein